MEETSEVRGGHGDDTDPAGSDYDVFLSFRGPDTRHGITDHLYESMTDKGICVFRDDEEIRRGEEIGGELERAIHGSKVYVIVFSRNYASSTWCLRELAMIMDCRRDSTARKMVLPIFSDVDPNDVKLRTDLYRSALDKHKGRYGEEEVKWWEEALVKVGSISGWDYKRYRGEGKFVRVIVQDVLRKLNIRDRRLSHHLIGIDDRVDRVVNMLNFDSPEVRVMMVHGMGGIGKTTLANVVFNRICSQFDGCSFLPDVRESSAGEGGIVKLQTKLLNDILGGSVAEVGDSSDGMNQIKKRLRCRRVLIIFDDVSERSQLSGSVGNCEFFGSGTRIIVTTRDKSVCKGMTDPKAIYTYEMEEYTLQKLKRVPHKDVIKILLISYEGLDEREKQIFLDIACFSDEMSRRYASYMWEACGLHPKYGVAVLVNKSLVKVLDDDEFGMHDLIRDMGIEIVCLEGLHSLGMRSRLWDPEDALNVVHQKEGTNKVLAINLGVLSGEHRLACEEFEGMSNLRFLWLHGGQFIGNFRNFRMKLMWLCWDFCERGPNPAFFNMKNLVVLKISGSGITDELMKDLRMGNLKALEIRRSKMTTMPDLSCCSKLERINLEGCHELQTLHSSVGKLEGLISLHIENCYSLRSLPEELGSAKSLREFSLKYCKIIEEIPEYIGRLRALRVFRAIFTQIRKLPASIGNLKDLEVLEFAYCPLDEGIPPEIGGLSSLEELNLEECNLCRLPGTIHQLSSLRSLFLSRCPELWELPELPTSLTKLRVESDSLQLLPDLSSLTNLTELVLKDYVLVLGGVSSQKQPLQLPWLGKLHGLQRLDLRLQRIPVLLSTELSSLSRLVELQLGSVHASSVLQLPSSLCSLRLSHFKTALPWEHYSNLRFLHRLDLFNSTLTEILLGGLDKLGSLTSLTVESCMRLVKLSDLACLRRLNSLRLTYCPRLVDISGVEKMELLEELVINSCDSLCRIPDLLDSTRLKRVSILCCDSLLGVPCLIGECYLDVEMCRKLSSFRGPYRQYPNA